MIEQNKMLRIEEILRSLDNNYREITDYNTTYWSMFLLTVWIVFALLDVVLNYLFYTILFIPLPLSLQIAIGYATSVLTLPFLFTILMAASVNLIAFKPYRLLNRIIACNEVGLKVQNRIKVNFLMNFKKSNYHCENY